jgi:RNA polymerase sigma factor for flagellar operon FliA
MGLIDAVERFDPAKGVKFETYAITRIRGSIIDELRSQDWVPRSVRQRSKNLSEVLSSLEGRLGRPATDEELSKEMGITPRELGQILSEATSPFLSLDELVQLGDDGQKVAWVDNMVDEKPGPAAILEESEFKEQLVKAIDSLPEREKTLLSLYYTDGLTLKEIGLVLSVSESRVCQLHTQAILRLRTYISRYLGNSGEKPSK